MTGPPIRFAGILSSVAGFFGDSGPGGDAFVRDSIVGEQISREKPPDGRSAATPKSPAATDNRRNARAGEMQ